MVNPALVEARLVAQGLVAPASGRPSRVVSALGAMQGQDLPGVISSIALRLGDEDGVTEGRENGARPHSVGGTPAPRASVAVAGSGASPRGRGRSRVERVIDAFNSGQIVRGYPMRGTVFALPAADAAWMTELCAGLQRRGQAKRLERQGITAASAERAQEIFLAEASRQGDEGGHAEAGVGHEGGPAGVTRGRLKELWEAEDLLGEYGSPYVLITGMVLAGKAVYGPIAGRDHLVVPTQSWLPTGSDLEGRFNGDKVAATAELLRRYLGSHGPAGLRDFQWWTKLPLKLVKPAFELVSADFEPAPAELVGREKAGTATLARGAGAPCSRPSVTAAASGGGTGVSRGTASDLDLRWVRSGLADEVRDLAKEVRGTFLLPGFDEIVLGYSDRLAFMAPDHHNQLVPGNNGMFRKTAVRGGKFIGMWQAPRTGTGAKESRKLELDELTPLSQAARRDVDRAFKRYPHF